MPPLRRVLVWLFTALAVLLGCEEEPPDKAVFDKPLYAWGKVRDRTVTIRGNTVDLNRPYLLRTFERYRELMGNTVVLQEFTHQELEKNLSAAFLSETEEKPDLQNDDKPRFTGFAPPTAAEPPGGKTRKSVA